MKWTAKLIHPKPMELIIQEEVFQDIVQQQDVLQYHIYVYERDGQVYDYMQDDLETAMSFALRKFHVPLDAWQQVE